MSMLVINRFVVDEAAAPGFTQRVHAALGVLARCAGFRSGRLSRAFDDPVCWCLVTEWDSVGAYRRALGGFDVKVTATPLLAESVDEPSAYETLAAAEPGGGVTVRASDRAAEGPGR